MASRAKDAVRTRGARIRQSLLEQIASIVVAIHDDDVHYPRYTIAACSIRPSAAMSNGLRT
jgi:hypothetical protein